MKFDHLLSQQAVFLRDYETEGQQKSDMIGSIEWVKWKKPISDLKQSVALASQDDIDLLRGQGGTLHLAATCQAAY